MILVFTVLLLLAIPARDVAAEDPDSAAGSPSMDRIEAPPPIVNPYQVYTYETMLADLERLQKAYPGIIETDLIGKTEFGRAIWAVRLGTSDVTVFLNGSHHAREWISTCITMKMLDRYARAYYLNERMGEYDVRGVLDQVSIWFVPMVSPDGVALQQEGLRRFPVEVHPRLISINDGSTDFNRWKANARGVDNNRQYPARWEHTVDCPGRPSYANFRGESPLSELENKALRDFTYAIKPEIVLSYHSSGRVIYFPGDSPEQQIAEGIADLTGYRLVPLQDPAAGYTDWFVDTFNRPAYTPELSYSVGPTNPPLSVIPEEWQRNKYLGLYVAKEGLRLWEQRRQTGEIDEAFQDYPVEMQDISYLTFFREAGLPHDDYISSLFFSEENLMVPLRPLTEKFGFHVNYLAGEHAIEIQNEAQRYRACLQSELIKTGSAAYPVGIRIPDTASVSIDFIRDIAALELPGLDNLMAVDSSTAEVDSN